MPNVLTPKVAAVTAMRAELDLERVHVTDRYEAGMHVGDAIRALIRTHLADAGYTAGTIADGPQLRGPFGFEHEDAHTIMMTFGLAGALDWRVDDKKVIHAWAIPPIPSSV